MVITVTIKVAVRVVSVLAMAVAFLLCQKLKPGQ